MERSGRRAVHSAHGTAGEVRWCAASRRDGHLLRLVEVALRRGEEERTVAIEAIRPASPDVLVKFRAESTTGRRPRSSGLGALGGPVPGGAARRGRVLRHDLRGCGPVRGRRAGGGVTGVCDTGASAAAQVRTGDGRTVPWCRSRPLRGRVDVAAGASSCGTPRSCGDLHRPDAVPGPVRGVPGRVHPGPVRSSGASLAVRLVTCGDYAADRHRVCDDAPYGAGPDGDEARAARRGARGGGYRGPAGRVPHAVGAGAYEPSGWRPSWPPAPTWCWCAAATRAWISRVIDAFMTDEVSVGDLRAVRGRGRRDGGDGLGRRGS